MIRDYIVALTNLYGIVPKEKVVEIYNQQNEDKMTYVDLGAVSTEDLEKGFVYVYPDHFVNDSIDEFDEFDIYMAEKAGKPYYVPKKQELLKYVDSLYFEDNKAYRKLIAYMKKHIIEDEEKPWRFVRISTWVVGTISRFSGSWQSLIVGRSASKAKTN